MYERKTCQRAKAHKKGIESFIGYDPSRDISEISHIDYTNGAIEYRLPDKPRTFNEERQRGTEAATFKATGTTLYDNNGKPIHIVPQAFHIAVPRGRKVTIPAFPQIEIHHYTDKILNVGVMKTTIDGYIINVYDVERSVCDAVKFRNKIGIDVCAEIISNYLERPERNISKLMDYAKLLRVNTTLKKYLEVKL